ncbi:molecular chaperone HtpG [Chiayiivirga flava]|uniref:Chaperone protein HtpG n=1 Tax=Chiayiivirga flava TaxID=659595 RepID=A0A7W8DAZ2_9GAMM|nr:molecular chaperone HtpG [Chiayiivirga flava]MBB5209403.1 molecular chaperone HtpG [Chiayiivirga flava]
MSAAAETFEFQSDVQQVLRLVIHSLYSNKTIFLRELISNASDACDKLRFEALKQPDLTGDQQELRIDLSWDKNARTLTVSDTGIGMTRAELIENLGTIARSGTRAYLDALEAGQKADAQLIGQFGVGFYSAFIVADRVAVTSRRAGSDEAWTWTSAGDGRYTLEPAEQATRGTTIVLHLKDGEDEFLDGWTLRSQVRTYSDHIGFPIRMPVEKDGAPTDEFEVVNQASALWTRPKNELSDADYQAFYKHVSHDFGDALAWTHNRVEGNQNFTSLLFVPAKAPFDFGGERDVRKGLKLYIKRVFIMDAAEQMLPNYLRFVRGVIDSDDLPLNVSRELLQNSRGVEKLKAALTRRVLDLLERIARDEPEKYLEFWKAFGATLKEGLAEDPANKDRLAKLLRVASTHANERDTLISLDDYIARMKPGQSAIWYLTADGWNAARNSPQLEALRGRGIEVLLLHERIDEWMIGYLDSYADKKLKHVAKGEFSADELGDAGSETATREAASKDAQPVVDKLKAALGDTVKDVRVSRRLTQSPSCLVLEEYDMALHMQRLLKAAGHEVPAAKPILEINPSHPLLAKFDGETDDARRGDLAFLLFEQAQLAEGAQLDDPAGFVRRMNALLLGG